MCLMLGCTNSGKWQGKAQIWDYGWKLLRGGSALMAQILGYGPEFRPEYTSTFPKMVYNTPARNWG